MNAKPAPVTPPNGCGHAPNVSAPFAPGILCDAQIRALAQNAGMIEPFVETQKREGMISYGLSSYGYDARISDEFMVFTNVDNAVVDPKNFSSKASSSAKRTSASSPPTLLSSRAPWNTSASQRTFWSSVWANPPTRAAASSSTSRRWNRDGKAT